MFRKLVRCEVAIALPAPLFPTTMVIWTEQIYKINLLAVYRES